MILNLLFKMKKLFFGLFLFLILAFPVFSAEVITEYSQDSLAILNEELRKSDDGINNLKEDKIEEPSSKEQGDILYYDGDSWEVLHHGTSGQYLKTQGDGANPTWATFSTLYANRQLFTSTGTFTAPTGVTKIFITMCGGGGGGGRDDGTSGGGGGGAGAWIIRTAFTVVAGNNYTVTVGTGGAGATAPSTSGAAGGNTSFTDANSITVTCNGGSGGGIGGGGNGGAALGAYNASEATAGTPVTTVGGNGGTAPSGGRGGGGGNPFGTGGTGGSGSGAGQNGIGFGAGGSGGCGAAAGNGANGFALIEW